MARAVAVDLAKEHADWAFPRQLREFIYCGDHQCRETAIDFFVHDEDRQPLTGRLALAEWAGAKRVATIDERAPAALIE